MMLILKYSHAQGHFYESVLEKYFVCFSDDLESDIEILFKFLKIIHLK